MSKICADQEVVVNNPRRKIKRFVRLEMKKKMRTCLKLILRQHGQRKCTVIQESWSIATSVCDDEEEEEEVEVEVEVEKGAIRGEVENTISRSLWKSMRKEQQRQQVQLGAIPTAPLHAETITSVHSFPSVNTLLTFGTDSTMIMSNQSELPSFPGVRTEAEDIMKIKGECDNEAHWFLVKMKWMRCRGDITSTTEGKSRESEEAGGIFHGFTCMAFK